MDSVGHSTSCMCEDRNPSSILGDRKSDTSWQPSLGKRQPGVSVCKGLTVELCLPAQPPSRTQLRAASTPYVQQQMLCFLTVYLLY